MSFWRRWLKQLGYVRIRDYGLVATDAGQIIRVSDGAVVGSQAGLSAAPALPPPLPPAYNDHPPTPTPTPSPLKAEPAPAFAPPRPPAAPAPAPAPAPARAARPRLPLPPVPRAPRPPPPATITRGSPPRRQPAGSSPPPIGAETAEPTEPTEPTEPSTFDRARGDTTVVDEEPTLRDPPIRAAVATRRSLPRLSSIGAQVGDATVVDKPPERPSAPLPRLSARLAARRKG